MNKKQSNEVRRLIGEEIHFRANGLILGIILMGLASLIVYGLKGFDIPSFTNALNALGLFASAIVFMGLVFLGSYAILTSFSRKGWDDSDDE